MSFWDTLGGIGKTALGIVGGPGGGALAGGLLDTLGWKLGEGIFGDPAKNALGDTNTAVMDLTSAIQRATPGLTAAGMYNKMGQVGAQAGATARQRETGQLGTAEGRALYNTSMKSADMLGRGIMEQGRNSIRQAGNQAGAMRNATMGLSKAAGWSPAASAEVLRQGNDESQKGNTALASALMSGATAAATSADQIRQQAGVNLGQDISQYYNRHVVPYMTDVNQATTSLFSPAMSSASRGIEGSVHNPLGGLVGLLGHYGGGEKEKKDAKNVEKEKTWFESIFGSSES